MSGYRNITKAYQSAGNLRSQRERDAEVFDVVASRLRDAEKTPGSLPLAKALADNSRLWQTIATLMLDDNNPQSVGIRKSLYSLATSVRNEMDSGRPDITFLVEINQNIAAGLRGVAPASG